MYGVKIITQLADVFNDLQGMGIASLTLLLVYIIFLTASVEVFLSIDANSRMASFCRAPTSNFASRIEPFRCLHIVSPFVHLVVHTFVPIVK